MSVEHALTGIGFLNSIKFELNTCMDDLYGLLYIKQYNFSIPVFGRKNR